MKPQIKYIELKTGHAGNGPAWIARVEFSKSGQSMYFNGQAFKGNGHGACSDIETKKIYWISGVKKNAQDRHRFGNGKIMIERGVVDEYLAIMEWEKLDMRNYDIVDIAKTDKSKFTAIENSSISMRNDPIGYLDFNGLSKEELEISIEELKSLESGTNPGNGLKYYTIKRMEAERLLNNIKAQDYSLKPND